MKSKASKESKESEERFGIKIIVLVWQLVMVAAVGSLMLLNPNQMEDSAALARPLIPEGKIAFSYNAN